MAQNYSDAPPAYETAVGNSSGPSRLQPVARNGIPPEARRSMEDEHRDLPPGWVRQYDVKSQHQFFVDTNAKPHRSIWHHPYDDDQYLSTLPSEERERVQELARRPTLQDIAAEDTDDEEYHDHKDTKHHDNGNMAAAATAGAAGSSHAQASSSGNKGKGKESFGQKMKDKLTGSTHEERVRDRKRREEEEQRAYQRHQALRQAMNRAIETGQPQLVGKDAQGHDMYLEPPRGGQGYGMRPQGQYNPYANGPYQDPNARFLRPDYGYQRPYGPGYGMGYGMPLMLGGGLMGGMMLGGMMGGF